MAEQLEAHGRPIAVHLSEHELRTVLDVVRVELDRFTHTADKDYDVLVSEHIAALGSLLAKLGDALET